MALEALKEYYKEQGQAEKAPFPEKPRTEPQNLILAAHMELQEKQRELYKQMADNIKHSELLRSKINKDIQAGADHYSLLLDAIKCISLMTGDTAFYEQNIKALEKWEPK